MLLLLLLDWVQEPVWSAWSSAETVTRTCCDVGQGCVHISRWARHLHWRRSSHWGRDQSGNKDRDNETTTWL